MAEICPFKTEYRNEPGSDISTLWVAAISDGTNPLATVTWYPAADAAGYAALETALGLAAGDISDEASLLAALGAWCSGQTPLPVVMEDDDGNPYYVQIDPVTGAPVSAWDVETGAPFAGDLTTLEEIQDRDVEQKSEIWCIDGVSYAQLKTCIFEADHADGAPPLAEYEAWSLANDPTGAPVADPTAGATLVTRGVCPLQERRPADLCCCGC